MTYKEAHEYLDSLLVFGIKLGLENMEVLCRLLGNPENSMDFVHVAGTNGKGSSCAMLAASLKNCGLKTGFYSSPFLYRFTERWRVDGLEVSEDQVAAAIGKIASLEPGLVVETGVRPTYFEVLTAAAFLIFKEEDVEVVVWETGMGGRLDATNVVTPLVSIITNIELDHTAYLGDTLEAIAYEKGGIIKQGIPFVCGDDKIVVVDYFEALSFERNSKMYLKGRDFSVQTSGVKADGDRFFRELLYSSENRIKSLELPSLGKFQCDNAACVLAALEVLSKKLGLLFDEACFGLEHFVWPGRMEMRQNGLILDGAHNPVGARALVDTLDEMYPEEKFEFICGILSDKDWREVIAILREKASSFYFVEISHARTSQASELRAYVEDIGFSVRGCGSSKEAVAQIERPDRAVVVGSLYLIGEVLSVLNAGEPAQVDSL